MNREKFFILTTAAGLFFFNGLSFGQFVDNFEYYFANQQLSCQNPVYWTTWSSLPCDSVEDPYLSTNHSYSGSKSVRIVQNNDLVKPLGSPFYCYISFWVYIPTGKSGYFNLLSGFTPNPFQWGMECYFDEGGGGRLYNGSIYTFNWTPNTWQFVLIFVDLGLDEAQFWFDGAMVSSWQWSRGGLINLQLDAIDFFGATANDEMYFDDFIVWDGCLSCTPPNVPTNLTAEEIFNPYPQVLLNWQDNSMIEYAFYIIRKNGYPNDPGSYEYIGTTTASITELIDSVVIVDSTYTYGVVAHGYYGYSDTSNTATITVKPIPVELTTFTASVSGNDVHLNWSTATELNNYGFEVEKTSPFPPPYQGEGGEASGGWEKIGFVSGHGTTTEQQHYFFVDEFVSSGKYQYRLKQIDYDGTFEYSDIVEVEVGLPIEFSLSQNYPNPFNPSTKIKFTISDLQFTSLKVYDVLGNVVATLVNEQKPAGTYEVEFDASGLPSGIYFYQLRAGSFVETKKMMLMK